jgi:anti-sigma B factor antagonist
MFEIRILNGSQIKLIGRLDASQAENATAALKGLATSATADCSELEYISSAGIGVIIETFKRLRDAGHTLTLASMNPRVRNVFAYAGLDKVLRIE